MEETINMEAGELNSQSNVAGKSVQPPPRSDRYEAENWRMRCNYYRKSN